MALLTAAVALAAAGAGYFVARSLHPPRPPFPAVADAGPTSPETLVGTRRPDFALRSSAGVEVSADDFAGRVLLVNFWASWCKPCVEEMPMLSRLHETLGGAGFSVVGIAVDRPDLAKSFAGDLGLSYPVLIGDTDVVLTGRRYGNRSGMLPYSVLVGPNGIVRWARLGALKRDDLEPRVRALLPAAGPGEKEGTVSDPRQS